MNILLTRITGFIGRHTARNFLESGYKLTAIIRLGTKRERLEEFQNKISLIEIDLADTTSLREYLTGQNFKAILHIGALRGGRKFSEKQYAKVNIDATEELCNYALDKKARFIFCSSVGVFGAIPSGLPATETTPRQNDNFYHYTKIEAEKIVRQYVRRGLQAAIIRPAITYGTGDYGFPYTLTKLVDKKMMFLPNREVRVHLTHIQTLVQAFRKLLEGNFKSGAAYVIADREPVRLQDLVRFIEKELRPSENSRIKKVPAWFFDWTTAFFKMMHNELWISRLQLISQSWYYDTENSRVDLGLQLVPTIPEFKIVTDWYREIT